MTTSPHDQMDDDSSPDEFPDEGGEDVAVDAYDEADLSALAPGSVCPGYHARPFREVCNSIKAI